MALLDNLGEKLEEPECKEICYSNKEIYYKNKAGSFQNSICYCKDLDGGIITYPY